jgi:hypothetical protein
MVFDATRYISRPGGNRAVHVGGRTAADAWLKFERLWAQSPLEMDVFSAMRNPPPR